MRAPTLLHEFLDTARRRWPDAPAIDVPETPDRSTRRTMTYAALWSRAGAIARRVAGVTRPDTVVAVMLPRTTPDLFAAQIGVNRAHGAFTCPDSKFPDAHLRTVLENAGVRTVIGDRASLDRIAALGLEIELAIDVADVPATDDPSLAEEPIVSAGGKSACERCLAYMISTSGTTGAPKGVMIEHRGIVNLIASDLDEFRLGPGDRVGQGSSAAYDSSIEETWLALASGATVVVLDDATMRLGPDLTPVLRRERITVFCPPPTLLRTTGCEDPQRELPDLRLLYVGGEALAQDLADRWARGKRLVNGYGPTECSVTVVRGDVRVGESVTIGTPVRGHTAHILDERLAPVPDGQAGELCIAGPGLARGYRGREQLTAEKFPTLAGIGRAYRTGDLARREPDGRLQYLGRIDAQVKIHGYRIELEAIEARLAEHPGVHEAACCVQGTVESPVLCAFIVPRRDQQRPTHDSLRAHVRSLLPVYMVPSRWSDIDALPRTIGGKVDRRRLPTIQAPVALDDAGLGSSIESPAESGGSGASEFSHIESIIRRAFASTLRTSISSIGLDVPFSDLPGGDSIGAIALTCELRRFPETARLTTRDVLALRTVRALAVRAAASGEDLDAEPVRVEDLRAAQRAQRGDPIGVARPKIITALQGAWVLLWLAVWSIAAYAVGFEVVPRLAEHTGLLGMLSLGPLLAVVSMAAYCVLSIAMLVAVKRLLIGTYAPITYRLWSGTHLRHWIVEQCARAVPWTMLSGTVALNAVLRLLGARIGSRVHIHRGVNVSQGGWDLLSVGDDATIACDAWLGLVELDNSCAVVAPVSIGRAALIDVRAGVGGGARVGDGAHLHPLAWLADGSVIPDGQAWSGVPARDIGAADLPAPEQAGSAGSLSPTQHASAMLGIEAMMRAGDALLLFAAALVGLFLLGVSEREVLAWLSAPSMSAAGLGWSRVGVVATTPFWLAWRAVLMRLMGRVREGEISRWSVGYIRVWHKTRMLEACGRWLSGTLFWPVWLRMAGMRIGAKCEVSTIIDVVPELVEIGGESFFADGIYLGGPRVAGGRVRLGRTTLGAGTFLGNHAVLPAGAYSRGMFVGVSTVAAPEAWPVDTGWFGIPALRLHRREVVEADRSVTFNPGPIRFATRVFWEVLRFGMGVPAVLSAFGWLWLLEVLAFGAGTAGMLARIMIAVPLATLIVPVAECAFVVALKWMLLGRTKARQHPLWSCWCSRWDFLYVVWQFCAGPQLTLLQGSLLLNAYLRLTGVRIGRRVALGPGFAQVVDPDMLTFEDDTTIAAHFQAHSFEDRVLKLAPVVVRRGSTIAEQAVVFYGSDIGEGSLVSPNSVVMKNERIEPGTCVAGSPLRPLRV
ncbi:MAG: amino acid adenylation domain-containing protein [Planctomyces sp.]